ncbi:MULTISPECIES: tripartite tricarboxylate transporter substrate binding protein BugE [Comamonas]|jgi:tripartite-type tricarboxylate transporter receptor subunit TctC|uniref:Tripartite tricarboxylate transporter substrate binding protein BugE n=1 Tax=Comamonas terrigena TaxID=32013 RepID=A0A2A7USI6_COMTR|nr:MULTISPECIES: tripartite tricarboxylate transporter substrate binding protein BugE [Comamonas]MBD9533160.1 tripartite tricarboxylate transporter substrate binding protein BugE [Comamonas sp. CMM01]MBV7418666.1 tripartite tricarboxylate transporter substrate binding protein BugE [Comamonas sp. CMM03]MDH1290111.1 tripartite tricarboxylate transporter substrate binding protein BugE [Comamonas terrigena]PEH88319.1 tripartite tricarboxylate transporter substrate binding protein BugE [Comamonas te
MQLRRTLLASVAAAAALSALAPAVFAADAVYPSRPIKLIVPFGAGGSTDMVARLLAEKMGPILGQAVVIENKGGAGGSIGASEIAKSAPDGYTIGMATVSTHGANPAIMTKLPYDAKKDFAPITNVMSVPSVFVVHPSVPAKTMKEFIALAKAHPGKYTFASPGTGSLGHANIENFMNLAGIELLHIPYKGAGQALTDALGGQVNAMTDNLPSSLSNIQAGKLRPLAVLAFKRAEVLPDVPTYTELGYAQMGDGGWFGLVAPAGTPKAVIAKLNAAAHKAMQDPAYLAKQKEISGEGMANTPEQFAKQIDTAIARYTAVAQRANIKIN